MNRETWHRIRKLSWKEADDMIRMVYDPVYNDHLEYQVKRLMADFFTALVDRFPWMTGDILHSVCVDALAYDQGVETPEELIINLLEKTGFDIRLRVHEQPNNYVPKEAKPDDGHDI